MVDMWLYFINFILHLLKNKKYFYQTEWRGVIFKTNNTSSIVTVFLDNS